MTRPGYYSGRSRRPSPVRPPARADRSGWRGQPDQLTRPADRSGQTDTRTGQRTGPDTDVIRPDSANTARPDTRTGGSCQSPMSGQTANESSR
jgi:hypothetical protein